MTIPALRAPIRKRSRPNRLPLATGTYITDDLDLFRCVSVGPAHDPDATALLEDCLTLELIVLPLPELNSAKYRLIDAAPEVGGTGLEPVTSCL